MFLYSNKMQAHKGVEKKKGTDKRGGEDLEHLNSHTLLVGM